jgi:hypothetical protein
MSRSPIRNYEQKQRVYTSAKKKILGAWTEDEYPSVQVDGTNPEHIKCLLEDLAIRRDQIVAILKTELVDNKLQQEEALAAGLIKLPKAIRQMTVRDFNQSHGCDILAILKSKDGVQLAAPKKMDVDTRILETPAPRPRNANAPNSILRTARRGEGL